MAMGGRIEAAMQVVIGVDAHKRTQTLVAADELGRQLAAKDPGAVGGRASRRGRLGDPLAQPTLGGGGLPP